MVDVIFYIFVGMMKVVVIEDQVQLRRNLIHQIHESNLGFEVIGEAHSVSEGIKVILKCKPDIVFFDIEIIEGSSFEILDVLPEINFKSVFATAHDHLAIKAIKYSAFDFLLKPFQPIELKRTLVKLRDDFFKKDDYKAKFELLFNELKGKTNQKIAISSLESVKYIGTGYLVNGNYNKAALVFKIGLKLADSLKITKSIADFHFRLGSVYQNKGENDKQVGGNEF